MQSQFAHLRDDKLKYWMKLISPILVFLVILGLTKFFAEAPLVGVSKKHQGRRRDSLQISWLGRIQNFECRNRGGGQKSWPRCQSAFKTLKTEARLQYSSPRAPGPQNPERTPRHTFAPLADPIATSLIFLPYLLASSHTFALEKWHLNGSLSHVPIFGGPAKGKRRPKNFLLNLWCLLDGQRSRRRVVGRDPRSLFP